MWCSLTVISSPLHLRARWKQQARARRRSVPTKIGSASQRKEEDNQPVLAQHSEHQRTRPGNYGRYTVGRLVLAADTRRHTRPPPLTASCKQLQLGFFITWTSKKLCNTVTSTVNHLSPNLQFGWQRLWVGILAVASVLLTGQTITPVRTPHRISFSYLACFSRPPLFSYLFFQPSPPPHTKDVRSCPRRQLTVKTSSSKRRKLSSLPRSSTRESSPATNQSQPSSSPSLSSVADIALPSCEEADDPASLSFQDLPLTLSNGITASAVPSYVRTNSVPVKGWPSRLQTRSSSLTSINGLESSASSPSAANADLTLDSDAGGEASGTDAGSVAALNPARSHSPFIFSKRAIMGEDGDLPKRSSSPLKRRASTLASEEEQEEEEPNGLVDVEMTNAAGSPSPQDSDEDARSRAESSGLRAMSIDPLEGFERRDQGNGALASTTNGATDRQASNLPSIEKQVETIQVLLKMFQANQIEENDHAFLVSHSWLNRALSLSGDPKLPKKSLSADDESLGPVDNSDIIWEVVETASGPFVRLKQGTGREDFEPFPLDAWDLLIQWHGIKKGQLPITREAVKPEAGEPLWEYHPFIVRIHRVWSETSPFLLDRSTPRAPLMMVVSRRQPWNAFVKEVKYHLGIPLSRKTRFWSVRPPAVASVTRPNSALTPPDSPEREPSSNGSDHPWTDLLIDAPSVISLERGKADRVAVAGIDQTHNPVYNGSSTVEMFLSGDCTLVIDEGTDGENWVLTHNDRTSAGPNGLKGLKGPSAASSGRSSPTSSGPLTRGRSQKARGGKFHGVVGFQNLGNTCYMNSALQCMRSVEELTKYFLSGEYKNEINDDNPLGYNGQVAHSYGKLLREVYEESRGYVAPKAFKNTVGRARPTFAGWGQQDSQEFLGFMLDALQEDLSRVKRKPYIPKPDSTDDMIDNPAAIKAMADQVWDITRKRDDSIIADLFTGMYKSTLKCPSCAKISITFDPFNNLTLPLPVENVMNVTVRFFPLNDAPVDVDAEIPKHSSHEALKLFLSARTGVPADHIIGGEEFRDRFFKIYTDFGDVSEDISSNDFPNYYQLEAVPTNYSPKTKSKKVGVRSMLDFDEPWVDPRTDHMAVPVLHRVRGKNWSEKRSEHMPPHFIMVTKEEALSEDVIRRKILEKIATFSTWGPLCDDPDMDAVDPGLAATSDEDSNEEAKVVANSVEGEEDLVDVTMKDSQDHAEAKHQAQGASTALKVFNTKRPNFLDPESFLLPELQNIFDMYYFSEGNGQDRNLIPTGWQSTGPDANLRLLSSRAPPTPEVEEEGQSPASSSGSGTMSDGDESAGDTTGEAEARTRMVDESDDDTTPPPIPKQRPIPRGGKRGKKPKTQKAYGRKANKRRGRTQSFSRENIRPPSPLPQPQPRLAQDYGALIRLGEGILVEWSEEAWSRVYGKHESSRIDLRGSRTFVEVEKLRDPLLEQKRKTRVSRRSKGITLDECLDEFEKAEVLSEQDMWYCPRCKEHRRASKKFDLWKSPDILVCHLKRFSTAGYRRDKLDVLVDFPVEGLDLTERVINKEDGKGETYDLIAVDEHFGGLGGGHYTAYAKNFLDGNWYSYNDSSAHRADPKSSVSNAAYLLFYRRRSSLPLGGPGFTQIIDRYENDSSEDDSTLGEDQRLGGGSYRIGSSSAGKGSVVTHHRGGLGLVTSTAAEDDEELPPYSASIRRLDQDEQDEGVDLGDETENPPMFQQLWSWKTMDRTENTGLAGLGGDVDGGFASDRAEGNSSGDEIGLLAGSTNGSFMDADDDTLGTPMHVNANDFADVVDVVSPVDPEVTEIHLDGTGPGLASPIPDPAHVPEPEPESNKASPTN